MRPPLSARQRPQNRWSAAAAAATFAAPENEITRRRCIRALAALGGSIPLVRVARAAFATAARGVRSSPAEGRVGRARVRRPPQRPLKQHTRRGRRCRCRSRSRYRGRCRCRTRARRCGSGSARCAQSAAPVSRLAARQRRRRRRRSATHSSEQFYCAHLPRAATAPHRLLSAAAATSPQWSAQTSGRLLAAALLRHLRNEAHLRRRRCPYRLFMRPAEAGGAPLARSAGRRYLKLVRACARAQRRCTWRAAAALARGRPIRRVARV